MCSGGVHTYEHWGCSLTFSFPVVNLESWRPRKEEGRREAASNILSAQITRKFGKVPDWARVRLAEADQSSLDRWAVQILDAQRIEEVFA